jgi:hypothetical protein
MTDQTGLEEWQADDPSPPKRRIKDAAAAHALYNTARDADKLNAYNRKAVDEMVDGEPPYDQGELDALGQSETINLNFGEGFATIEAALSSYNDLTSSVDVLVNVYTHYGQPDEREEWCRIIAEEYTRMCKSWGRFEFNVQLLSNEFVKHGVAVSYFDHDIDWRWKTCGLRDFKIPRDTLACEEEIDHAITTRTWTVSQLYEFIENEQAAKDLGWNPEMVKKAIWTAYTNGTQSTPSMYDWEEFQTQIKNNDLFFGYAKAPRVKVNHTYVREFSGKFSHYITDEAGVLEDFMYKEEDRFESVSDCFTIFTYGIGSNGYFHSIRGLGYKIFPQIQVSNRLRGKVIESTLLGTSLLIQPQSADDVENLNLLYYGPYAVVPPGLKFIEHTPPDIGRIAMPVVNDLSRQIQNNTGSYASRAVTPEGQERTKFEVQAQLQQESTLSTSAMNLFYLPWGRLHTAVFRRLKNRDYSQSDPGGREYWEFKRRLAQRGVPMEALYRIHRVEPVRALGYGSPGKRLLAQDQIFQLSPQFDPIGKRQALRDQVAAITGDYEVVDRYVPRLESNIRQPIDAKIAELENAAMHSGQSVPVTPGENADIHLGAHISDMLITQQEVQAQQIDPKESLAYFKLEIPHCGEHLQALAGDPTEAEKVNEVRNALKTLSTFALQLSKAVVSAMQIEQQKMEEQASQGGGQPTPEMVKAMLEHKAKIQMMMEEARTKFAIKAQDAAQRRQIRDLEAAAKITRDHAAATDQPELINS